MEKEKFFSQFDRIETYDYESAVLADCEEWLKSALTPGGTIDDWDGWDLYEFLEYSRPYENVSGNIDGSYFCNAWKAKCCLFGNESVLQEALEDFGIEKPELDSPEWCDVIIREHFLENAMEFACKEWVESLEPVSDEYMEIDSTLLYRNGNEIVECSEHMDEGNGEYCRDKSGRVWAIVRRVTRSASLKDYAEELEERAE